MLIRSKYRRWEGPVPKKTKAEKALPLSTSIPSLLRDGSDREFRRLIYSLIRFSEMIVHHRDIYGAYIGVTGPQYHIMTIIAASPNATAGTIATTLSVSNQFIVSETAKLVAKKIVEKTTNEADRRSMLLNLTPRGRELLRELSPLRRESNDLMYRSLSGNRAKMLQEIMDTLIADAEIALHELDAPHRRSRKLSTASAENSAPKGARRRLRA
jgi:MarR family transcriptional regulator, organic hydroperoxide resistance regulator